MNDETGTFQAALVTLLERACRAEEALAEVVQSVATFEERQAAKTAARASSEREA